MPNDDNTGFAHLLNASSCQGSETQSVNGSPNRCEQTQHIVNSEHGNHFGSMPALLRNTSEILVQNDSLVSENVSVVENNTHSQNQCNFSEVQSSYSMSSDSQTYAKVVEGSGSHISRSKDRTLRRKHSASPYRRDLTAVRNGNSPISNNRSDNNTAAQKRVREVKR
jgi:hypothetical protein